MAGFAPRVQYLAGFRCPLGGLAAGKPRVLCRGAEIFVSTGSELVHVYDQEGNLLTVSAGRGPRTREGRGVVVGCRAEGLAGVPDRECGEGGIGCLEPGVGGGHGGQATRGEGAGRGDRVPRVRRLGRGGSWFFGRGRRF